MGNLCIRNPPYLLVPFQMANGGMDIFHFLWVITGKRYSRIWMPISIDHSSKLIFFSPNGKLPRFSHLSPTFYIICEAGIMGLLSKNYSLASLSFFVLLNLQQYIHEYVYKFSFNSVCDYFCSFLSNLWMERYSCQGQFHKF